MKSWYIIIFFRWFCSWRNWCKFRILNIVLEVIKRH